MHLHAAYMEYSECLPTLLDPLAERTAAVSLRHQPALETIFRFFSVANNKKAKSTSKAKVRKAPSWPRSSANFSLL